MLALIPLPQPVDEISMTEDEAMSLMVDSGFQERSEASEKWNRARLSSTQLCEYFLGGQESGHQRLLTLHSSKRSFSKPFNDISNSIADNPSASINSRTFASS